MTIRRSFLALSVVTAVGASLLGQPGPVGAAPGPADAAAPEGSSAKGRVTFLVNTAATRAATDQVAARIRRQGAVTTAAWPQLGVVVGTTRPGTGATEGRRLVDQARRWPGVASAGLSGRIVTEKKPLPRRDAARPARRGVGSIARAANAPAANRIATGRGVTVGVADQGIFGEHASVRGRYRPGISGSCLNGGRLVTGGLSGRPNALSFTHGTAVASVAVGSTEAPMRGVAPQARVASIRVVSSDGNIYPEASICSAMWAVGAKLPVLNASYGIDWIGDLRLGAFYDPAQRDQAAVMTAVRRAYAFSRSRGVLTVAAAGNAGVDLAEKPSITPPSSERGKPRYTRAMKLYPAELPSVLTVSGYDPGGEVDLQSNVGLGVIGISAVSSGLLAGVPNRYSTDAGTSFAAPAVAGAAALVKELRPRATPERIQQLIAQGARKRRCDARAGSIGSEQKCRQRGARTSYFGAGTLDALATVRKARG